MELVGTFSPSDSLTCFTVIMDYEYNASFSVQSVCFRRVQMRLSAWAHTSKAVCNFPLLNLIRHLFLLRVILLDMGFERRAVFLLVDVSLFGGFSFLCSSPSRRWDLP